MPTLETLNQRLEEAETALHRLNTGEREVKISVGDYGMTEFSEVNVTALERYISKLKNDIAKLDGRRRRRPILMRF